jgi:hypothetical protein
MDPKARKGVRWHSRLWEAQEELPTLGWHLAKSNPSLLQYYYFSMALVATAT